MILNKVEGHLEMVHADPVGKLPEFFHRKLNELNNRKQ
jgi:hypothetical protein